MTTMMKALVYEGAHQMNIREVPVPSPQPDEVLIKVAYSGICGSEISGYEGKNALRKPPLIMGHEFSGHIAALGGMVKDRFPELSVEMPVTVNPLTWCGRCEYCLSGRHHLCPNRKLLSATLPGSNAEYVCARADTVLPVPENMPLPLAALTEPAACAVHAARLAAPQPDESVLVAGAGPIGLFIIQAFLDRGVKTVYCADLNAERLAMAEALGAVPVKLDEQLKSKVDIAVDAVGVTLVRQACVSAVRSGGRVLWVGLHEQFSPIDINDTIRREIVTYGSFAYTPLDFRHALSALAQRRLGLQEAWTRVERLEDGSACFEELLAGSAAAKIWLTP
jgi:threonine dehydrogenase-like Zn-dependent dehydrogenase